MLISKTPYRVSFFGGGSDYPSWFLKNGGEVISATINKHIYITCKKLPNFFNLKYRIIYSRIENAKKISEINHKAVRFAITNSNIRDGLEIHYHGDLPARSGMGSSSTFLVGLLNILEKYKNKDTSKLLLAKKSINFEQNILKENVGCQDQIAASYGGFNSIKFYKNNTFKVISLNKNKFFLNELSKNLILVYTGISRTAQFISNSYSNNLLHEKKKNIMNILDYVQESKKIIKDQRLKDFGLLLHESWMEKKELSKKISNPEIDNLYSQGLRSGALGGKLLGAGGGGFMLFYVEKEKKNFFLKRMKKHISIPIDFSIKGSEIILGK